MIQYWPNSLQMHLFSGFQVYRLWYDLVAKTLWTNLIDFKWKLTVVAEAYSMYMTVENNEGKFISPVFEQDLFFITCPMKNRVTCSKIWEMNFPLLLNRQFHWQIVLSFLFFLIVSFSFVRMFALGAVVCWGETGYTRIWPLSVSRFAVIYWRISHWGENTGFLYQKT